MQSCHCFGADSRSRILANFADRGVGYACIRSAGSILLWIQHELCSLQRNDFVFQTDLDGIKWRRLSADSTFCLEPLDDPVLQSFTKCIQNDILCVWRRVQRSSDQKAPDQLSCNKELWIFWYGDEPPNLRLLLAQELQGECRQSLTKTHHWIFFFFFFSSLQVCCSLSLGCVMSPQNT